MWMSWPTEKQRSRYWTFNPEESSDKDTAHTGDSPHSETETGSAKYPASSSALVHSTAGEETWTEKTGGMEKTDTA